MINRFNFVIVLTLTDTFKRLSIFTIVEFLNVKFNVTILLQWDPDVNFNINRQSEFCLKKEGVM
jgi:hypothetical protein